MAALALTLAMHLSTSWVTRRSGGGGDARAANGAPRAVMEAMAEEVSKSGRADAGCSKLSASRGRNLETILHVALCTSSPAQSAAAAASMCTPAKSMCQHGVFVGEGKLVYRGPMQHAPQSWLFFCWITMGSRASRRPGQVTWNSTPAKGRPTHRRNSSRRKSRTPLSSEPTDFAFVPDRCAVQACVGFGGVG